MFPTNTSLDTTFAVENIFLFYSVVVFSVLIGHQLYSYLSRNVSRISNFGEVDIIRTLEK